MPRFRVRTLLIFTALVALTIFLWQRNVSPYVRYSGADESGIFVDVRLFHQTSAWIFRTLDFTSTIGPVRAVGWMGGSGIYYVPFWILASALFTALAGVATSTFALEWMLQYCEWKNRAGIRV